MEKADLPPVDVLRVRPVGGHRIWLYFSDGCEGIRDLSEFVKAGGDMVAPLRDEAYFARVFIEMGSPTWPNGFDLDPINLYLQLRDAGALRRAVAAE